MTSLISLKCIERKIQQMRF